MPYYTGQHVFLKHPDYSWVHAIIKNAEYSPDIGIKRRRVGESPRIGEYIYTIQLFKSDFESKQGYFSNEGEISADSNDSRFEIIEVDSEDTLYPYVDEYKNKISDLLNLVDLHESTLLETLRIRFFQDLIYTYIGPICISMNPFKWTIPWYQQDKIQDYIQRQPDLVPHFWEIADSTFRDMVNGKGNQCILVSGNSGAGKTETVKQLIEYINNLSCNINASNASADQLKKRMLEISEMIRESSPILEAFGNAKTINNDNSSRFGKFIQLQFDRNGAIVGAHINNYLLEKSRLCYQAEEERSYHIFYQFLAGASDEELRKYFLSRRPDKYKSIFGGKCAKVPSIDDALEWKDTIKAMNTLGLTEEEQNNILSIVAAVLHLQNIEFVNNIEDQAKVKSWDTVNMVSSILKIDPEILAKAMITRTRNIMNKDIVSPCTVEAAIDTRNTITKAIYSSLFNWLIDKINEKLSVKSFDKFIGLLDIFGFETFEVNSFEQLCINYANESLQFHYNDYNFKRDIIECKDEGIDVTSVKFQDNTPCIELIQGAKQATGILQLLDEQCLFPKSTDKSFLSLISKNFTNHKNFSTDRLKHEEFFIEHFAGKVSYNVEGWLEKNKDELKSDILQALRSSSNPFIANLVQDPPLFNRKPLTVGGSFRRQLMELMDIINSTVPHWVRCIKSHPAKKPDILHGSEVMSQLLSSGVLETIKIRRDGFAFRIPHRDFVEMYSIILGESKDYALSCNHVSKCKEILAKMNFNPSQGQVGKTKVFLRIEPRNLLNDEKSRCYKETIQIVQNYARMKIDTDEVERIRKRVLAEKRKKIIDSHKELLVLVSQLKQEKQFIENEIIKNQKRDILPQTIISQEHYEKQIKLLEVCKLKLEVKKKEKILELQRRREEALRLQREREAALERMRQEREEFERLKIERERQAWIEEERIRKEEEERRQIEMEIAFEREKQLKQMKKRRKRIEERNAKLEKIRQDRERVERQQIEGFMKAKHIFEEELKEMELIREEEIREKVEKQKKLDEIKKDFALQETKRYSELYDLEDQGLDEKRKKELAKRMHIEELKKQEYLDIEARARDLRIKEKKNQIILHKLKMQQLNEIEQMNKKREQKFDHARNRKNELEERDKKIQEQMLIRMQLEDISSKIKDELFKKRQRLRALAEQNHKRLMKVNNEDFKKIIDQKIYEEDMEFSKRREEIQSKIDDVIRIKSPARAKSSRSRAELRSPTRKNFEGYNAILNLNDLDYSKNKNDTKSPRSRSRRESNSSFSFSTHIDLSNLNNSPYRQIDNLLQSKMRFSSPNSNQNTSLNRPNSRPTSPHRLKSPNVRKGLFSTLIK